MIKQNENELEFSPPQFPRTAAPYRIHWNWEPTYDCNYKCSYCQYWSKGKKESYPEISINKWREIWDRIFDQYWCCHVRFAGGEPTVYPDFFNLLGILLKKHTVDITTNLSFDITSFTRKVKPGGISISASFHPEFVDIHTFLEKVLFLHHHGYPSTIAYVAFPAHLEKMKYYKMTVEEKNIMFKIIPFSGEFKGRLFPRDYSEQEKMLMQNLATDSENTHLNQINSRWYDWNVKQERDRIEKKGRLCRMGQMYAIIHPDGLVSRCCVRNKDGYFTQVLGHILDPKLRLLDFATECQADNCPCFKSMLVDYQEEKWLPLWEALEHPIYKTEYIKNYLVKKGMIENSAE